jgi:hypothetical protein
MKKGLLILIFAIIMFQSLPTSNADVSSCDAEIESEIVNMRLLSENYIQFQLQIEAITNNSCSEKYISINKVIWVDIYFRNETRWIFETNKTYGWQIGDKVIGLIEHHSDEYGAGYLMVLEIKSDENYFREITYDESPDIGIAISMVVTIIVLGVVLSIPFLDRS